MPRFSALLAAILLAAACDETRPPPKPKTTERAPAQPGSRVADVERPQPTEPATTPKSEGWDRLDELLRRVEQPRAVLDREAARDHRDEDLELRARQKALEQQRDRFHGGRKDSADAEPDMVLPPERRGELQFLKKAERLDASARDLTNAAAQLQKPAQEAGDDRLRAAATLLAHQLTAEARLAEKAAVLARWTLRYVSFERRGFCGYGLFYRTATDTTANRQLIAHRYGVVRVSRAELLRRRAEVAEEVRLLRGGKSLETAPKWPERVTERTAGRTERADTGAPPKRPALSSASASRATNNAGRRTLAGNASTTARSKK